MTQGALGSSPAAPGATFFLALHGPVADAEGFVDGDLLAVSAEADAEPGDLVVWWTGQEEGQALARVNGDCNLQPVAGFSAPPAPCSSEASASIRGVVVGRLRQFGAGRE